MAGAPYMHGTRAYHLSTLLDRGLHAMTRPCLLTLVWTTADEEKATAMKRRSAFKLLTELLLVGFYSDAAILLNAVKALASVEFHRDKEAAQSALSLLASFAKGCREDILGLPNATFPALLMGDADEVLTILINNAHTSCLYPKHVPTYQHLQ